MLTGTLGEHGTGNGGRQTVKVDFDLRVGPDFETDFCDARRARTAGSRADRAGVLRLNCETCEAAVFRASGGYLKTLQQG